MPDSRSLIPELPSALPAHIEEHLSKLAKRGKRMRPRVRHIVEFCRSEGGTSRPDEETFSALQEGLKEGRPSRWREAVLSAYALGRADLTEAQRKETLHDMAHELTHRGMRKADQVIVSGVGALGFTAMWAAGAFSFLALIVAVVSPSLCKGSDDCSGFGLYFGSMALIIFLLLPIAFFCLMGTFNNRTVFIREEIGRSLGVMKRAESVPALLEACHNSDFLYAVGREALRRTLPSLKFETHYGTLGKEVVPDLCRLLRYPYDAEGNGSAERQQVVLNALAEIGDRRAIKPLEVFLKHLSKRRVASPLVMQSTEAVLQILRERVARETEQATLLRGSDAPVVPETLLRSYEEKVDEPQEQLLRPTQKD